MATPLTNDGYNVLPDHPAGGSAVIVHSDTVDIPEVSRGLYVGVGGNISMLLEDDTVVTPFVDVINGEHPFRVKRVFVTGTTATDLVALY